MMAADKIVDKSYIKIDSGKCSDTGAFPISNKATCEAAAVSLGLSDTVANQSGSMPGPRPEGCYYYRNAALWFGTTGKNPGLGSDALRKQICETGPQVDEKNVQVEGEKKARGDTKAEGDKRVPADNDAKADGLAGGLAGLLLCFFSLQAVLGWAG